MIYLTGDTHGRFERIGIFCDKMQTSRDDILIILGDAGINFHAGALDILRKEYLAKLPISQVKTRIAFVLFMLDDDGLAIVVRATAGQFFTGHQFLEFLVSHDLHLFLVCR